MSGNVFIISAPSGGGKTSLVRELLERDDGLAVSISHTTRPKRPGDKEGEDYYFVNQAVFDAMRGEDAFLESANVFGNDYGTSRAEVARLLSGGRDVLLEIDWQGAQQVRRTFEPVTSIFIVPPSVDALTERLRERGQDDEAVIARRTQQAIGDISHYNEYDHVIVNDRFEDAVAELEAIIGAHRRGETPSPGCPMELIDRLLH